MNKDRFHCLYLLGFGIANFMCAWRWEKPQAFSTTLDVVAVICFFMAIYLYVKSDIVDKEEHK